MPAFIRHEEEKLGPFPIIRADKKTAVISFPAEHAAALNVKDAVLIEWPSWVFAKGIRSFQEDDFRTASDSFRKVTKAIFGHEPSYFNLGLALAAQEKYREALVNFQAAAKYNPYNLFTAQFIVNTSLLLKKDREAEKKLKEIIERTMQDISAHLKFGLLVLKKNELESALDELTFVRNLDTNDITSRLLLAGIFLIKGNIQKANEYFEEVQMRQISDKTLGALYWAIKSRLLKQAGNEQEADQSIENTKRLAPQWKTAYSATSSLEKLLAEAAGLQLLEIAKKEFAAGALLEFAQSQVSKETAGRIAESQKESSSTTPAASKKKPYNLSGEVVQTVENYNRNPATSNPINDVNTETNLKINADEKGVYTKTELDWYYNRWDHTQLDYFKVNIKDNKNDEVDIGKFSSKNFADLVSHPTIEQGGRWWHRFTRSAHKADSSSLPDDPAEFAGGSGQNVPPSLGNLFSNEFIDRRFFKTTEVTALYGRAKKPLDLTQPKAKNDRTYETSGQFEQWVSALHLMTKPTDITEIGASYSLVIDNDQSASVSSTTYPLQSEAFGIDGKLELLDGKLKFDSEAAIGNYDTNINDEDKNKDDKAFAGGMNYKPFSEWEFNYDVKTIGKNFKVEGAYQTEDKITHTYTAKYSRAKNIPWTIRTFDYKFEPAHTNLQKRILIF
ncbi:MAG: hypothetical protein KKC84_02415 [Candidatus Omnitrophica bacterium]|nr:hypothetical protein [Candidatus Omnitrophota bacterium]